MLYLCIGFQRDPLQREPTIQSSASAVPLEAILPGKRRLRTLNAALFICFIKECLFTMPIHYKVVECTNPAGAAGVDYACDRAVKTSDYDFENLSEDIQKATTVTKADVVAVLTAAKDYVKSHLLEGQRVVLNELGALKISLTGRCFPQSAMTADGFNPASYISGIRVNFRPEAKLLKSLRASYSVKRISSDLMA